LIARARVLPVDIDTIETVAQLRNECRQIGHGLHQRSHNADLWIAATAIRWNIPLVAHDAIFNGCPRLELRTELARRSGPQRPYCVRSRCLDTTAPGAVRILPTFPAFGRKSREETAPQTCHPALECAAQQIFR